VDPISRLRRRVPIQEGPTKDESPMTIFDESKDPLQDLYGQLSDKFEVQVLNLAAKFQRTEENDALRPVKLSLPNSIPSEEEESVEETPLSDYYSSRSYNLKVHIDKSEIDEWSSGYSSDPHFSVIIQEMREETDLANPKHPHYYLSDDGLLYFEDSEGNMRLVVPSRLRTKVIQDDHETLTEGAHSGYHRAYNRLACIYFWPRMSKDIREFVTTCDLCQKAKTRHHAPYGLLKPIPIPSQPFEVISMDFITEMPETKTGFNNILVIIDKLTKFAIFIPTVTTINEVDTARLVFQHVISRFGLPRQIITDRDLRWSGTFWEALCSQMNIKRALTTSHHPQADGQTEKMNQILQTALPCYTAPSRDDWDQHLEGFALSYNGTPHSATGFAPAFLLFGYLPKTGSNLLRSTREFFPQLGFEEPDQPDASFKRPQARIDPTFLDSIAADLFDTFSIYCSRARDSLLFSQAFQQRYYNKGRISRELEVGDLVLINPHSLKLLGSESGLGKKLLMKFDGPFEIQDKISAVTYCLRLPSSYRMHPIINIAHLEPYAKSPEKLGDRQIIPAKCASDAVQEWEVDKIVAETCRKRGHKRLPYYRV
jgi:hypothetical protein